MIAELLLLQQLLDDNMVTPTKNTLPGRASTTATSTTRSKIEAANQAYKDYIERGRQGRGL